MARLWKSRGAPQGERIAALLDVVAHANAHAATPQLFTTQLSRALEPLLPHDCLELVVTRAGTRSAYRLGEHAGGRLWTDPSLTIQPDHFDVTALFAGQEQLLLADACRSARWPRGYFSAAEPPGAELRAIVGARAAGLEGSTIFLLVGSIGPELYDREDMLLIGRVAVLIAPQVKLFLREDRVAELSELDGRSVSSASNTPPALSPVVLGEIARLLATTTELREATQRLAELSRRVLPFDAMRFAVRVSDGDRVVLFDPGEPRPLPDLPSLPVAGTPLARVMHGEMPYAVGHHEGESRLVVPLSVAGRVHGALVFTAAHPAMLGESHAAAAQRLADVVAPHLELVRRSALLPAPYLPGWKRPAKS